ncbi:sporulation-control protein [Lysinibacillus composti]|uniref:Sporulation protein SpoOM n=1 Tax=Lysinibacillus composti TaxID=720633 RepID=A0A3N9UKA3_9BACI|nr:sporulation protein [Lysinibacillus composti]MBM7606990.1 sporulation-control protein [Lysinibacillus composti]RQW76409.1 sporulation protein SpoOM [Lysinibacillus composti]
MSFFNKVLASIGIGAAKVDTKLEKSSYVAGETVRGEVEVYGGNIDQQIDTIYLTLYTTYIKEVDDNKFTATSPIQKYRVSEPFTIQGNETKIIPFSFVIPIDAPITIGATSVWVTTELDIRSGADAKDKDFIEIRPSRIATAVLEEVQQLGFRLSKADCEQASRRFRGHYPFVQEFEFVPYSGLFRGRLDELEVVFLSQTEQSAELLLQVDRKARGLGGFLAEALDADESFVRVSITQQDLHNLSDKLKQVISRYA